MYHYISDHELIEWCNKWDLLTKIQKRLIALLEESPRVGNYSDIVKFCGINVNNQTANVKQIKKLVEWRIITISDFEEKDKEELEHQIGIAINSRSELPPPFKVEASVFVTLHLTASSNESTRKATLAKCST